MAENGKSLLSHKSCCAYLWEDRVPTAGYRRNNNPMTMTSTLSVNCWTAASSAKIKRLASLWKRRPWPRLKDVANWRPPLTLNLSNRLDCCCYYNCRYSSHPADNGPKQQQQQQQFPQSKKKKMRDEKINVFSCSCLCSHLVSRCVHAAGVVVGVRGRCCRHCWTAAVVVVTELRHRMRSSPTLLFKKNTKKNNLPNEIWRRRKFDSI